MRRMFLVGAVFALVGAMAMASTSAAQEPEFKLGFQEFAGVAPDLIGDPLEDERYDAIGNAFQQTTGGLLAWHRLDNVMDFTDGSDTFLVTPEGLLARSNEERFEFEVVREQFEEALDATIQALIEEGAPDLEQQIEFLVADFQEQLELFVEQPEQVEQEPAQIEEQPEQIEDRLEAEVAQLLEDQPQDQPERVEVEPLPEEPLF